MENNKLEELRENHDLTKKAIAEKLGVSSSVYARWENGTDIIPTKRLYQLSNIYRINIDYMLGFSNCKINMKSNNTINLNDISIRIREIRKDFNETLRVFTKRLNTSNSTWSAYETGKILILCAFLIEVCKAGNYSADWILGRSNIKYIKNNIIKKNFINC